MKETIISILDDSIRVKDSFIRNNLDLIIKGVDILATCIASGHKILLFGNGGSAADAQHIAAEFVNRFKIERPPLAAIALTTDTSILTSIGNDYHFNEVFSKQIKAIGKKDDVALGISTSGNSKNVVLAFEEARSMELITMGFTGEGGGKLAELSDILFDVPSKITARIQETHITIGHILCELVDNKLFQS